MKGFGESLNRLWSAAARKGRRQGGSTQAAAKRAVESCHPDHIKTAVTLYLQGFSGFLFCV